MGNLIINLDSLASGRLDITTGAFDYNTTLNLDPLASGRLDNLMLRSTKLPNVFRSTSLREARPFIGSCFFKRFTYLDPLASGRLDVIVI